MNATALLADLRTAGIVVQVHAGRLKLDGPRGALTESVLSAVRDSKVELLKLLEPADAAPTPGVALFHRGPGAGEQLAERYLFQAARCIAEENAAVGVAEQQVA